MMKLSVALLAMTLTTLSAQAFQAGSYRCATADGSNETQFKISSVNMAGSEMALLEVTRTTRDASGEKVYVSKGIANQLSDNNGKEVLSLAAMSIELKNGRPACAQ